MSNMNKESKKDVAVAIQDFYKDVFEFNKIAGRTLHESEFDNQLNTVVEEAKELKTGLEENNIVEVVDAICDSLYTASFAVGILDGNDDITKNPPKYLNSCEIPVEELIPAALSHLEEGNVVDFLGTVEDMCTVVNADIIYCLDQVSKSNLSKFPLTCDVDDPDLVCDEIEGLGRYDNVSYTEATKFGEPCYVFKATVDKSNSNKYPNGKVVKPPVKYGYFEPSLAVYE